jgi:D-alanyl-D-alanine endopeptidase (penicillin-binding protein 7)
MRSSDRALRSALTAAGVAALALVAVVCVRTTFDLPRNLPPQAAPHGPPAAAAPAAPRSEDVATAEPPAPPGVEVVPEAESPPPIPIRQSAGHAAGLNHVKDPLRLSASAAYAVDADTGQVLVQKNEDAILPIASLTKMMTGLLTVESRLPMDEVLTITEDDVDTQLHSRSRLRVGTTLTRREALHLALMSSENRAAHALGRTFPGGLAQFVNAMNNRAKQLGMNSTTYVDPTGLNSNDQSTAHDLALLAQAASREPLLREFTTTTSLQVALGGRTLLFNNSNRLVKNPKWDIDFQKTGYIVEAGMCMTVKSHIAGHDVLMVLLDSGDSRSRLADAERVKHWVAAQSAGNDTLADGRSATHRG